MPRKHANDASGFVFDNKGQRVGKTAGQVPIAWLELLAACAAGILVNNRQPISSLFLCQSNISGAGDLE